MRNPFVRQPKEKTTADWEHHCIVHELQYAYPDCTTTPGSYPVFTEEDFHDCIRQAEEKIEKLDLGAAQKAAFDALVELAAMKMIDNLLETRTMHQRTAIRLRTEVEASLAQKQARLAMLEGRLAALQAEAAELRKMSN